MEKLYIFMPQAILVLHPLVWNRRDITQNNKLNWLRDILQGIKSLHDISIIHRDIRPQNMLVMSVDPGRACLCDYGKAVEGVSDTATTIGPVHTLAPEGWAVAEYGSYTNKIDMWAYGYAIAQLLRYTIKAYPGRVSGSDQNPLINTWRHRDLLKMLHRHDSCVPEDASLTDLARKLLE